jgi:hypothetical protein
MQTNTNFSCDVDDDESCDHNNEDRFEEEQEDILTNTMVQNILSSEQIYDYFENVITVTLGQDFKPLDLFQDPHSQKLNSYGSKHSERNHKGHRMSNSIIEIYFILFIYFFPFETMIIMAHYSSLTHMNVKILKLRIHLIQF